MKLTNRRPPPNDEFHVECPECEGSGKVVEYYGDVERWYGCVRCGGFGDVSVDLDGYEKEEVDK